MREKTQKTPYFAFERNTRVRHLEMCLGVISTYKDVSLDGQAIRNENRRKGIINSFRVNHVKAKGMQESGRAQLWWAVRV